MRAFAALITQLGYTRSRNAKVALIAMREGPSTAFAWRYGMLLAFGHFDECRGVFGYWSAGGKARAANAPSA